MRRLVLIVSGSRMAGEQHRQLVIEKIARTCQPYDLVLVIHGACTTGVDDIVASDCKNPRRGLFLLPMPADWDRFGKKAGPIRNRAMVQVATSLLDCGWEARALAFPVPTMSPGTMHTIRTCERNDVPCEVIDLEL